MQDLLPNSYRPGAGPKFLSVGLVAADDDDDDVRASSGWTPVTS